MVSESQLTTMFALPGDSMDAATSTDDGLPVVRCEICRQTARVQVSRPLGDSVCPSCGTLLWVDAWVTSARRHDFTPDVRLRELQATDLSDVLQQMCNALAERFEWDDRLPRRCVRRWLRASRSGRLRLATDWRSRTRGWMTYTAA